MRSSLNNASMFITSRNKAQSQGPAGRGKATVIGLLFESSQIQSAYPGLTNMAYPDETRYVFWRYF